MQEQLSRKKEAGGQKPSVWKKLRDWSRALKREIMALYYAIKHPRTPLYAKVAAAVVVGYALSPIDLIPDFIPVLGYLDDVILLPLGIALVIRLIPDDILDSCRGYVADNPVSGRPRAWLAALIIIVLWLLAAYWVCRLSGLDLSIQGCERYINTLTQWVLRGKAYLIGTE